MTRNVCCTMLRAIAAIILSSWVPRKVLMDARQCLGIKYSLTKARPLVSGSCLAGPQYGPLDILISFSGDPK